MAPPPHRSRLRMLRPVWLLDAIKQVLGIEGMLNPDVPRSRRSLVSFGDIDRPGLIALGRRRERRQ